MMSQELGVYCMKCIGYDPDWQQFLVDNYKTWQEEYKARQAAKKARGKQPAKRKHTQNKASERIQRLAKRAGLGGELSDLSEIEGSDEDVAAAGSDDEGLVENEVMMVVDEENDEPMEVDEEDDLEASMLRHMARGTRSRPRTGPGRSEQEPIVLD